MRRILEYEGFIDREDLRKKIAKLVESPLGKSIVVYKSKTYFTKEEIERLISSGAMNVFSGLLPLDEEDDDKLINVITSIKSILYREFPSFFFYFFFGTTCTTRVIKWESVKT